MSKPALFNIYFAIASIPIGFPFAIGLALMKNSKNGLVSRIARTSIYDPVFYVLFDDAGVQLKSLEAYGH